MSGLARLLPYALAFFSSLCIMILELVSSRLVARHVGHRLTVWTSVIGIILGGNLPGERAGRPAGRPGRAAPGRRPALRAGVALTLCSLWVNAKVGLIIPSPDQINWELRTVLVVVLDFLVPATVLGMVGPVVAKMAVEQARKGRQRDRRRLLLGRGRLDRRDVPLRVSSYVLAPTSTIVTLVAAALAVLAAALIGRPAGLAVGLCSPPSLLGLGLDHPARRAGSSWAQSTWASYQFNYLVLAGHAAACRAGESWAVDRADPRRRGGRTPRSAATPPPDP